MTPPSIDAPLIYHGISERRKPVDLRDRLLDAAPAVVGAYGTYDGSPSELVALTPATTTPATSEDLKSNYSSRGAATVSLKGLIHDHNTDGWCRLCGRAKASTLDHYLPQATFPEFSVLPLNLVPACFDCNLAKGERYRDQDEPIFIHAYIDVVPLDVRFLFADVAYREGTPTVVFRVAPPAVMDQELGRRVQAHFDRLGLAAKYQFDGVGYMGELRGMVKHMLENGASPAEVSDQFRALAAGARLQHGANFWRYALLEDLTTNVEFCSGH